MKRFRAGKPDLPSQGVKETTAPTHTPAISTALRYHIAIATPCYPCRPDFKEEPSCSPSARQTPLQLLHPR